MVHILLALALTQVVAEDTTCQDETCQDETSLLQHTRRFDTRSLQTCVIPSWVTAEGLVDWAAGDHSAAEEFATSCPVELADWMEDNPDAATEIFYDNHVLAHIMFPEHLAKTLVPGTTCMDGSLAGYYSTIKGNSDDWVIFLQGGGGCSSLAECEEYMKKTSDYWDTQSKMKFGLYEGKAVQTADCEKNPHFCEANHVYIKYCSGDTHSGQRNFTNDAYGNWYASGHLNFHAIIQDLKDKKSLDSASRVLLTGSSAGGMGTLMNADFLKAWLPGAEVKAAPIAGWFMPHRTTDHNESWMSVSLYADYSANISTPPEVAEAMWNAQLDWSDAAVAPACIDGESPHTQRCMNMPTLAEHMNTPIFISQNMWDSYHFGNLNNVSDDWTTWTATEWDWAVYYANAVQNSTVHIANKSGNGLFMPATISHGSDIGSGSTNSAKIQGMQYLDVLADWFYDLNALETHVLVDACHDEQTCNDKLER